MLCGEHPAAGESHKRAATGANGAMQARHLDSRWQHLDEFNLTRFAFRDFAIPLARDGKNCGE
jgi:hypothetical protein